MPAKKKFGVNMDITFHKDTFDRIPDEKRARILEIATAEFANKGYDSANINEIAEKAGISVGALYKYFDSKENFFLTCVSFGIETLEAVLKDILESSDNFLTKVEKIARLIQRHSRDNKDLIKLYNELTSESNSELVNKLSRSLEEISSKTYSSLIIEAQKKGEIRKDAEPGLYAYFTDSLFMMLQFSYSCEYYQERFRIYAGENIFERDEAVIKQFLAFIKSAFIK
jgi:TetR/AcrR family transcriptional regulator